MNSSYASATLTVVIICCDDERVFDAIASVDSDFPIIVSLVPNPSLEKRLTEIGVHLVKSQRGNYSISCNRGLDAVETDFAFILDSDCVLHSDCLTQIQAQLQKTPITRAHVNFLENSQLFASNTLTQWYSDVNNRLPIRGYTPGLGLRLKIKPLIGGYFFDERIFWSGDSEFSHRVKSAGIEIAYEPSAIISHAPISFAHFLKSGYMLGMGSHAQVKLGLRPPYESPTWILRRLLYRLNPKHWLELYSKSKINGKRLLNMIWTIAFYFGYYRVFFKPAEDIGGEYKLNEAEYETA